MTVEMQRTHQQITPPPVRIGKKIEPNASFCKSSIGLPLAQLLKHVLKEIEGKNNDSK